MDSMNVSLLLKHVQICQMSLRRYTNVALKFKIDFMHLRGQHEKKQSHDVMLIMPQ